LQHDVVNVLHSNSGVFAENVEGVQDLLKIHQPDFPLPALLLDHSSEGVCGSAVTSAGIEENEVQPLQSSRTSSRSRPGNRQISSVLAKEQFVTVTSSVKIVSPEIISSTECNLLGSIF
jgi:hypothetical protein